MPNHISNRLTFHTDEATAKIIFSEIGSDQKSHEKQDYPELIDFNKLIPYPEQFVALDKAARDYEKAHPEDWKGKPKDGFNSGGIEWCRENWGTKWPAYDQVKLSETSIYFETAWSCAVPVFLVVSQQFPEVEFTVEYADEDKESNAGILKFKRGELILDVELRDASGVKMWFLLNPEADIKEYGYSPETFEYVGE